MMNKRIIFNHILEAFEGLTVPEQMILSQNSKGIEDRIISKFGMGEWIELKKADSEDWRDAWKMFEQHHGIFNHGDYHKIMS